MFVTLYGLVDSGRSYVFCKFKYAIKITLVRFLVLGDLSLVPLVRLSLPMVLLLKLTDLVATNCLDHPTSLTCKEKLIIINIIDVVRE